MEITEKYEDAVVNATVKAGAIGVPGAIFPPADIMAMSAIWTKMAMDVARLSGQPISTQNAGKLATAAGVAAGAYLAGSKLFTRILLVVPGGVIAAAGINSTLNAVYTWQLGEVFVDLFDGYELGDDVLARLGVALMGMKPSPKSLAAMIRALQRWLIKMWRRRSA